VTAARRVAYEHVAFDLDGTLVDSRADLVDAVNHVLGTLGLPPEEPETLYGYVGEGARVLLQRALGVTHQDRIEAALGTFMRHYADHLLDRTRPYPGIEAALAELGARGVAMSVLTNKPEAMSRAILEGLGLASRFVDVIGGDSLPVRKPDPTGLERLRAATSTPRERMLLVGDSAIDVRTARAGGVSVCGVTWGLSPKDLVVAEPDHVVAHPRELLAVVDGR
jgi:phosphoglycolate phosphatase